MDLEKLKVLVREIARSEAEKLWRRERAKVRKKQRELHDDDDDDVDELDNLNL